MTQMEAFVNSLTDMADPKVINFVIVTCDSKRSFRLEAFAERYPDRIIDAGIAEASAVCTAFGLSQGGFKVFVAGFASFVVLRALEPIRSYISYHKADVTILGGLAGFSASHDGIMHHSNEDISLLRCLPNLRISVPSDNYSASSLARKCLFTTGPHYVRLVRRKIELCSTADHQAWCPMRWRLKYGNQVVICSYGPILEQAMKASVLLNDIHNIKTSVLEVSQIAPLTRNEILQTVQPFPIIVVCEDQSVPGGLGGALKESLHASGLVIRQIGMNMASVGSGSYDDLLIAYGLDTNSIVTEIVSMIR